MFNSSVVHKFSLMAPRQVFNSSVVHKFSLMAPKPQRFRHLAETTMQGATAKKPRTLTTSATVSDPSPMKDAFAKYASYLSDLGATAKKPRTLTTSATVTMNDAFTKYPPYLKDLNEKRARVEKASYHITTNSESVISQLHRIRINNKEEVIEKAEKDLAGIMDQYISSIVKELQGIDDLWKLRPEYSPGVQEYIKAAVFCNFCKTSYKTGASLHLDLHLDEINASLRPVAPLQIDEVDYCLGLVDLTWELRRLAIGRISDGEIIFAHEICRFVYEIHREVTLTAKMEEMELEMEKKTDGILRNIMKIEHALFHAHLSIFISMRGHE